MLGKLNVYGFDKDSLEIMWNYPGNQWQRTKINATFSSWSAWLKDVPQGSVLGTILFNIVPNVSFFILKDTDVCNFADDTSPHACDISLDELLMHLENDFTFIGISCVGLQTWILRHTTRNFGGQGRFLETKALQKCFMYSIQKNSPAGKNFSISSPRYS